VKKCRAYGITVPIIPGLKPITVKRHLNLLPSTFHIDIPEELANEVEKCKNNEEVKQLGVEWTIQQSKELVEFGVPCLHYYSMGKSDAIHKIGSALF